MCRFLAYKGPAIVLDELLYQPENSLINQSHHARERKEPLNGDGFGVGWYVPDIAPEPAVYVSVRPAWNDVNLRSIAPRTRATALCAHIRAATKGEVSMRNCHPFSFGKLLMMHNGTIFGFREIKRALREGLKDDFYHWILGNTDTEHFFALVLNYLNDPQSPTLEDASQAFQHALTHLAELKQQAGIAESTTLNSVITDGNWILASRYHSSPSAQPPTLYYSTGARYSCKDGVCSMDHAATDSKSVLIVSEKLTDILEDWTVVPAQHLVLVDKELRVTLQPLVTST